MRPTGMRTLLTTSARRTLLAASALALAPLLTACGQATDAGAPTPTGQSPASSASPGARPSCAPGSALCASVHLTGGPDLFLTSGVTHPRGGFQPTLTTATGEEVTVGGQPLLPFVATDGGAQPMTATCTTEGGIAVWTATPHQPPGIVLAWDLRRTRYAIDGAEATRVDGSLVRSAVADPLLRKQMPQLFDATGLLADCRDDVTR